MELDDRLTLASAEGIDLDLMLAGIGSRGGALLLDLLLQGLVLFVVALVAGAFDGLGLALASIATFLVLLGYPILMETFGSGQTLGKRALGIAVVASDGTPVRFLGAVIRNVVRVVDALPGVYFVGCLAVLLTQRNQRLGDLAAGTLVVHAPGRQAAAGSSASPFGPAPVGLPPEAAGWDVSTVTAEEVAAVRSFLARRASLDPAPRFDLAQRLAFQLLPKVAGVPLDGGPERFLERVVAAKTSR
ncbi:MAG: hypothetical protein JWM47_3042 [Acidimicrobiales bacterium]|nr:hypothetical protein [Acidimicrobiales bacterium]